MYSVEVTDFNTDRIKYTVTNPRNKPYVTQHHPPYQYHTIPYQSIAPT